MYPRDLRGILTSIQGSFQSLFGILFSFFYRWLFTTYGVKTVWLGSSCVNLFAALLFLTLGLCGCYGKQKDHLPKPEEELDESEVKEVWPERYANFGGED
jgi:hypothetical protein